MGLPETDFWAYPVPGDVVDGRWRLEQQIGEGTHAVCFSAVHLQGPEGELVCLKISKSLNAREMFQHEMDIMARLSRPPHPHLAHLYDCFEFRRRQVIVMHLYIAGDVSTMMANGYHMKSGGLERAMAQLVLALHHMHSKSIMHRDIKLDNVYISESGFVLADFGASRLVEDNATTFAGTPLNMAPEILQLKPYDYKSDIYSLGAALYQLCTHDAYMQASTMQSLLIRHKSANPVKAFATEGGLKVNVELAAVISSMLAVNPEERPSTEQLLGHRVIRQAIEDLSRELASGNRPDTSFSLDDALDITADSAAAVPSEHSSDPHQFTPKQMTTLVESFPIGPGGIGLYKPI